MEISIFYAVAAAAYCVLVGYWWSLVRDKKNGRKTKQHAACQVTHALRF